MNPKFGAVVTLATAALMLLSASAISPSFY